ncbi:LuxR C-terminal-related transcriptional regulator [Pseudomonas sp. LS44]|uniref:LuxR C-terminal-related transcriptional regulator n=1 Tax=Pseudomonas sp. LS44 TaxID=1357074 RepID=UPI00215B38CE|nr:LuxR C-terminal-related transcriptional regulator [Pseudomonas sp. LS44]UVE19074.1 LuxR C-terminal-related transcriptional regulator [Pseudomonas sp. LS44]
MDRQPRCAVLPTGVIRDDLLELLDRSEDFPLTLIMAPAGSGKSTLLAHWLSRPRRRRTLYYTLQARDNEPLRFFRRLLEAIRTKVADFDLSWFNPLGAEIAHSPVVMGEYLAEALGRVEGGLCLVFDDFQHLDAPLILEVLAAALRGLPPSVRVVISSRNHPGFSLSRFKLDNALLCIEQHDLRLSAAQIQALNADLGGPALSEGYVADLLAMTEGWVAGVKVALLAYARFGTGALERFDGTQPEIVDYFGHVVLEQLTPVLRDFFLGSAIFEKFNGELCDRVFQRQGSALLLEDLAARQLFMLPVDGQPGWFRYHALLHDFLGSRLAIEGRQRLAELHCRAAGYYQEQGDHEQALQHARRSGEPALWQDMLECCCEQWVRNGQFGEVLKWVAPLPETQLLGSGRMLQALIAALILSRRFHQARYYLELLDAGLASAAIEPASLQYLVLNLELFQHDKDFRLAPDWEQLLEPGVAPGTRARVLTVIAYHHLLGGRLDQSIRFAVRAKVLLVQTGHVFLESYADLIIALCNNNACRATVARKDVRSDYERTESSSPAWVNRATGMVVVLYEQSQFAAAQQLCEDLIARVNSSSATEAIATVYLTLARLLHRRKLQMRAERLLEQLAGILQLGNYERFASQLVQERLRQAYVSGNHRQLESLARHYQLDRRLEEGHWDRLREHDECWERYGLAVVYWLLARGAQVRAGRILKVLAASLRQSEMRARALIVDANLLVLGSQGQDRQAQLAELAQLVEEYGLLNITCSVFDEAPGFGALVAALVQSGRLALPERYRQFYAEFCAPEAPPLSETADLSSLLTGKEAQILDYLLQGLSNTEISARSGTALSTTKWHLKNIYAKLEVTNRTEAILRVRPQN